MPLGFRHTFVLYSSLLSFISHSHPRDTAMHYAPHLILKALDSRAVRSKTVFSTGTDELPRRCAPPESRPETDLRPREPLPHPCCPLRIALQRVCLHTRRAGAGARPRPECLRPALSILRRLPSQRRSQRERPRQTESVARIPAVERREGFVARWCIGPGDIVLGFLGLRRGAVIYGFRRGPRGHGWRC